jgi:mono/diheme cytochrome c family protein
MKSRAALLPLLLLAACPRLDPMNTGQRYDAYQASEFYPDGLAMRHPPAGTVPFRSAVDPVLATGLGPDGRPTGVLPVAITAASLARGRLKFDVHCAVCHGVLGDGESQVAMNMALRRPPSLHDRRGLSDGEIFRIITGGYGLMPSYAAEISIEDRWSVVAYVRALQLSQHATPDQLPPEARERLEKEGR